MPVGLILGGPQLAERNGGAAMEYLRLGDGQASRHVRRRCQQRGVRKHDLMLLHWADRVVPVGGGRWAITLTRREAAVLRTRGIPAGVVDRIRKRALVVDTDGDMITVVVPSRRRGLHYRRDARRRRRRAQGR
jgi:hypothetical protein